MADIEVTEGPYKVYGLPLFRVTLHPEETGPGAWEVHDQIDVSDMADADGTYWLCRCGQSANKPFCDGSHPGSEFDGTETASTTPYRSEARVMHAPGMVVRDDAPLCARTGFCTRADTSVWKLRHSNNPADTADMKAMIDVCPSGRLTRAVDIYADDSEPPLPVQVLVLDDGSLLVTGGATIVRNDKEGLEPRNRVTLCRCGASANKPLCDGSHTDTDFTDS